MKKTYIWGILAVFVLNILLPMLNVHSVFTREQNTSIQTIVKTDHLSVNVKPTVSENQIQWQVDYERTAQPAQPDGNFQRMKLRLLVNGKVSSFPNKNSWEALDDNWFGESKFAKEGKGSLSFVTDTTTEKLQLEVQLDQADSAEGKKETVVQNVLESKYQGPFDLRIPVSENKENNTNNTTDTQSSSDSQSTSSQVDNKKDTSAEDSATDTSSKAYNDQPIILSNYSQSAAVLLADGQRIYRDLFDYTNDAQGMYPTHRTNNYPDNTSSQYIYNFNYGSNSTHSPANNQGYTGVSDILGNALNFNEGYHFYQNGNNFNSGVYTKKTVAPTTDPNTFNVQVDVVGGASKVVTPIDLALVIDKSGSMNDKVSGTRSTKFQLLQNAVDAFASNLLDDSGSVRIGLTSFQSTSSTTSGKPISGISKFGSTGFTSNKNSLMQHAILKDTPVGGTPTYLGVEAGIKLLTDSTYGARSNAKKVLIVLTDGKPTFWPQLFRNGKYASINDASKNPYTSYDRYTGNSYDGNGSEESIVIPDTYNNTSGGINQFLASQDPNNQITNRYSIAFGFTGDNNIKNMLGNIGTFYDASNASTISTVLENIRRDILNYNSYIDDGQLSDSMSEYVNIVDGETSFSSIQLLTNNGSKTLKVIPSSDTTNYPAYAANIQGGWDASSNKFLFTNMNLGSADGIVQNGFRLNYQVQLKEGYRDGKFYPANGPTFANGRTYSHSLGFAVPSIRSETFSINVEKIWQGDSKYSGLRKDITLQLQQKIGNSGDWKNVDGQTVMIAASATGDALKGKFSNLPAVSIKEKSDGSLDYQQIYYRVIESNRVPGYKDPVIAPNDGITIDSTNKNVTITNTLMTTNLDFTKVDEAGKALNGAEFTLYRKVNGNPQEFNRITNPTDGKFRFENLPIGEYILKETVTPSGFSTRADAEFSVKDSASGTPSITVTKGSLDDDSSKDGNQLLNQLIPFTLAIVKQDAQSNKKLENVSFSLSDKNTGNEVATMKTGTDGTGHFLDGNQNPLKLETGKTYVIKETDTLDGYILDKRPIEVTVNADGSLTVTRDGEPYKNYSKENQEIQVRIDNQKKGLLPSTGGKGRSIFVIFAFACLVLAIAISGVYFYRNRKGAR